MRKQKEYREVTFMAKCGYGLGLHYTYGSVKAGTCYCLDDETIANLPYNEAFEKYLSGIIKKYGKATFQIHYMSRGNFTIYKGEATEKSLANPDYMRRLIALIWNEDVIEYSRKDLHFCGPVDVHIEF